MEDFADATDEGSAMMELAFDIAPNANYKFHTSTIIEKVCSGLTKCVTLFATVSPIYRTKKKPPHYCQT